MNMKLLTKALLKRFAKLVSQENKKLENHIIVCKFFNPIGAGTWYATEMWYNITYADVLNTQVSELYKPCETEKINPLQKVCQPDDCKDKDKGLLSNEREKKSSIQKWDKNGQWLCNDIQTKSSECYCKGICFRTYFCDG